MGHITTSLSKYKIIPKYYVEFKWEILAIARKLVLEMTREYRNLKLFALKAGKCIFVSRMHIKPRWPRNVIKLFALFLLSESFVTFLTTFSLFLFPYYRTKGPMKEEYSILRYYCRAIAPLYKFALRFK